MIDIALLRVIKYKEEFDKVARYIPLQAIDKKTKAIVQDVKKYFESSEGETKIDFPSFRSLFFTSYHKNMNDSDIEFYNQVLTNMEEDVPEVIRKNLINQLLELDFATEIANITQEFQQGEDIDIIATVGNLYDKARDNLVRSGAVEFADFSDSTVGEEGDDDGYAWPLEVMNQTYRKIQAGDQYIVAARPGKGKTSFLTFLNWGMAQQMPKNKIIVWFNNESRRQRIMSRQIMSATNATNAELSKMQVAGTLEDAYVKAMGRKDKVRVYDIHGKNNYHLEEILEAIGKDNVGAIVCDMLDNVKFPASKDLREDQRLEQLYQWLRSLGVEYECPTFPTSQISNEGVGLLFPTENMLKDSKTGKQGACDGIIMIGCDDNPLAPHSRGLSMPKTKSKREGQQDLREEILFDADRGRFK